MKPLHLARLSLLLLSLIFVGSELYSQAGKGINYQAVARDQNGWALPNQQVIVEFSIIAKGTSDTVWQERHTAMTNEF